jgi:hypothetical protein
MKKILPAFVLAGLIALVSGCTSPTSRINENPELFARLTPEQQELIKQGRVAIGFDKDMVHLALGDPDHIRIRTDAQGEAEVWSYVTYEADNGMLLYTGYYHRRFYGRGRMIYPYYMAYPSRREHEHFRVIFRNGRVVSIESEMR